VSLATPRVRILEDLDEVQALTHPVRLAVLGALRQPDSAAGVARAIRQSRQLVNYHLKELERARLVERSGERRKGNFVEQLYRAVAHSFTVSPRLAWSGPERNRALGDQVSLDHLVAMGEQLQRDASALLDRAAFDGEQIDSASVEADVRFADAAARSAFMTEYLALLGPLLKKHGSRSGTPFRVALATYPNPTEGL
jgi:DNA-binding transcriptional ArsR family regulator